MKVLGWVSMGLVALGSVGCQTPKGDEATLHKHTMQGAGNDELNDAESIVLDFAKLGGKGLQHIYFDHDSASLRVNEFEKLKKNAEVIATVPELPIQIAGHCDERGTQEYNLALGEKRALAVRDDLVRRGVDAKRLFTISYGEERPAVLGTGEAVWAQNRRVESYKYTAH